MQSKIPQRKISKQLLDHFGLKKGLGFYWSKQCDLRKELVKEAILENQMLYITGNVGCGKTTLMNIVKSELPEVKFIYVSDPGKGQIVIGSILRDGITELSGESVRGPRGARMKQFTRIVGGCHVQEHKKICFIIEEAHRLPVEIFRAVKELREQSYADISPFFSFVFIGHPLLAEKIQRMKEANYRSWHLELSEQKGWLNYAERIEYLKTVFGGAITAEARRRIAITHLLPLEMDFFVETKMKEAYHAGITKLDDRVIQPTAREMYDALKAENPDAISYKIIADITNELPGKGVSKTTVNDAIMIGEKHPKHALVKKAISKLHKENFATPDAELSKVS